jgi:trk system potassium uptake protein TrkA
MRAVFIGASSFSLMTASLLLKRGHEVVIIEMNKECIAELSPSLDCAYLHGDGSKPAILKEADPVNTDVLFCLTGDDRTNILASLVGRSLGFQRVVTRIEDRELEHICLELGLEDTIIPARTIGRFLADMFEGHDLLELSTMIREEARVFSFVIPEDFAGGIKELGLPDDARLVLIYRQDKLIIATEDMALKPDDEAVVVAHRDRLPVLEEKWNR